MENMMLIAGSHMSIDMALENSTFSKPIKIKDPDKAIEKIVRKAINKQISIAAIKMFNF